MNKQETAKIMAIIFEAYHFFYKDSDDNQIATAINLWTKMFADTPYELVENAVFAHISNSEKPPTVAHIKKEIGKLTGSNDMSEAEAVNMIMKATRNSIYNSADEFKKLPPMLQKLVGSPAQLREWATADSQTINTVVSSNLQRSFRVVAEREKELNALPETVKQFMRLQASNNTRLIE